MYKSCFPSKPANIARSKNFKEVVFFSLGQLYVLFNNSLSHSIFHISHSNSTSKFLQLKTQVGGGRHKESSSWNQPRYQSKEIGN